jgi:glycerol-1-phosphate dehydrogenase [NAD(P)+]
MTSSPELPEGMDTKFLIEGPDCFGAAGELLPRINEAALPVLLIQDANTKKAAGEKFAAALASAGVSFSEFILKEGPLGIVDADYERAVEIREVLKSRKVFPLAVGGGTINDLVKRAAWELKSPYVCAGTAASVDGYCSFGASLVHEGYKTTMPCSPPLAVIADTEVLRSAPYDMTASGYGDLYAKLAAAADWLLADRLGIEKIHQQSWDLVQKDLPRWLSAPEKLREGDSEALAGLFRGLTMSGLAMQVYKDSRPASGAEHMISHIWEMRHLSKNGRPLSHGFKVAAGTVITVSLMEVFYRLSQADISVEACRARRESWDQRREAVRRAFPDPKTGDVLEKICREKWLDDKAWTARIERLAQALPELKTFTGERLGSPERVMEDLQKVGCPVSAREFDLTKAEAKETVLKAQMIRKRYTVLDALYETGLLEELLDAVL